MTATAKDNARRPADLIVSLVCRFRCCCGTERLFCPRRRCPAVSPVAYVPEAALRGEAGVGPDAMEPAACDDLVVGLTVVIVDDHAGFRSSARALLEAEGFDVVGEAGDGASGLAAVGLLRPRVVLLDIQLPDIDGFEVAERLAGAGEPPVVVLVSTRGISAYRRRLARSAARGFIPKSELSGSALSALVS